MDPNAVLVVYTITVIGILGCIIGSFLNVVIYRVPVGVSLISPPSTCPRCNTKIKIRHNIPVIGWIILKGRCYQCKLPISIRYPIVEFITGLLFAGVLIWNGFNWQLLPFLYLISISIALTLIDLDVQRLPNVIVTPAYLALPVLFLPQAITSGEWEPYLRGAIGLFLFFILYFIISLYPKGMGLGDVKLSGVLGFVLGWSAWSNLLIGFFMPFFLGGIFSVILLISKRVHLKGGIPFGPWMLIGTWITLIWGETIWETYLKLIT